MKRMKKIRKAFHYLTGVICFAVIYSFILAGTACGETITADEFTGGGGRATGTVFIMEDIIASSVALISASSTSFSVGAGVFDPLVAAAAEEDSDQDDGADDTDTDDGSDDQTDPDTDDGTDDGIDDGSDEIGFTDGRSTIWYLAEGTTKAGFATYILIQNPAATTAECTITYMRSDSSTVVKQIEVGPTSRYTINLNTVTDDSGELAFVEADASTKIECTNGLGIVAERAMYRDSGGIPWAASHGSIGVTATSTTWYLAEGTTTNNFDEYILIQNPNAEAAEVEVTFMRDGGREPLVTNISIGATSRYTIYVNGYLPDENVSTRLVATNGVGIIAERAMYRSYGDYDWICAHDSCGVTDTSTTWYLAEGCTTNFDEWVLIQNPNDEEAQVEVTFMRGGGREPLVTNISVDANSRYTIYVNSYLPDEEVSTQLVSVNGVGIIAERAMYLDCDDIEWACAHDSIGVTTTQTIWYLAEGATTGGFDEWILVQNPSDDTAEVEVTFMLSDGSTEVVDLQVYPESRYTIYVNNHVPEAEVSTRLISTNGVGIIVERAMYRSTESGSWIAAHDCIGV